MRKWVPAIPIMIGATITAAVYRELPDVRPVWHTVFPFVAGATANETMPRLGFALLLPGLAAIVWVALAAGARVTGQRGGSYLNDRTGAQAIARFEPTFTIVVAGVVGLLVLLHLALLGGVVGWPGWTMQAIGAALGLGTAAVGNVMHRVRPNWIVGIRTRATLGDPPLWTRTHRYFGGLLMLSGIGVAVLGIVAPQYAFVATITALLLAAVLAHAFARTRAANPPTVILAALLLCASGNLDARSADATKRFEERSYEPVQQRQSFDRLS